MSAKLTSASNPKLNFPVDHAPSQPSPLRPNAAVFSPILSPRPGASFAVPPTPRFGGAGAESLDQWFKNLRKYEATLAAMAAAIEDEKFREELGTIEQWFRMLNESEQTASLYTLVQNASQEQITFLKAVLQQMSDNPNGDGSRSQLSSPATSRPPNLALRLPTTPGTPSFNISPGSSGGGKDSAKESDQNSGSGSGSATSNLSKALSALTPLSALSPGGQELLIKGSNDRTSWANMVNTPHDLMFQKQQPPSAAGGSGIPSMMSPTMGMPMMNPFTNPMMMANMGYGAGSDAQMLALQLMMSGMMQPNGMNGVPPGNANIANNNNSNSNGTKPQRPKGSSNGSNNWRAGTSNTRSSSSTRGGSASKSKNSTSASNSKAATPVTDPAAPRPEEDVDPELLKDIPAWLKTLRLHKYTDCFKGMTWQDMVVLDEDALENMGVSALGARRRLTKNFEMVKKKMGMADPDSTPAQES